MTTKHLPFIALGAVVLMLTACRVETKSEEIPEAEGSGKKAINIRVEPMSRDEVKQAANTVIDKSAELATQARDVATSAVDNAEHLGHAVTTISDTIGNLRQKVN